MSAQTNRLQESVENFERKKKMCLDFIEEVKGVQKQFEEEVLRRNEGEEGGVNERLSRSKLDALRDALNDSRLKVLIAGQFKTGKSTLVNAILGEDVLPAYSTPCTAVITEVEYAERPKAELHFKENINREVLPKGLSPKVLAHLKMAGNGAVSPLRLELEEDEPEQLEEYLAISDEEDEMEQKDAVAETPVSVCKLSWPLELCRSGAVIIDSPGLNEAAARTETTMSYVPTVDIIIHVQSAQQLFGMPDQEFLNDLKRLGSYPVLFIVNRFDLLNDDRERERVKKYALKKLVDHTRYGEEGIFYTSAHKALKGRRDGDAELLEASGLPAFERAIGDIFDRESGKIKLGRIRGVAEDLAWMTEENLPAIQKKIAGNLKELEKKFAENEDKFRMLDRRIASLKKKNERIIERFGFEAKKEIKTLLKEYAHELLPEVLLRTEISVGKFGGKDKQEAAVRVLQRATTDSLKAVFAEWSAEGEGFHLLRKYQEEISDLYKDESEEFDDMLRLIQADMDIVPLDASGIAGGDGLANALELASGAGVGFGIGMGAIALFEIVLGPVGWILGGLTLVGSMVGSALGLMDSKEDKLKAKFYEAASGQILEKASQMSEEVSRKMREKLEASLVPLYESMEQKIDDTRRPIQEAIAMLKNDQENIEVMKKRLVEYADRFGALAQKSREIVNSL